MRIKQKKFTYKEIELFLESLKRHPKNKAPGDAEEMQAASMKALQRAIAGGARGWEYADAADKIRRLSQVAIGAGYIFARLDDEAASKRRSPVMSDGRSKASAELADKIRKLSAANPNMSQTEMGRVLKVDRKTIGKYLNQ